MVAKLDVVLKDEYVHDFGVARLDVGPEGEVPEREGGGGGSRVAEAAWEAEGRGGKHLGLNCVTRAPLLYL